MVFFEIRSLALTLRAGILLVLYKLRPYPARIEPSIVTENTTQIHILEKKNRIISSREKRSNTPIKET